MRNHPQSSTRVGILRSAQFVLMLALVVLSGTACLPEEARVERSIEIEAPIAVVYEQVIDLKKNEAWSPWAAGDDTMVATYGDIQRGVGATSSWTSENMGEGSMRITAAEPNSSIEIALDFKDEGEATSYWKFEETNGKVTATWGFVSRPEGFGERVFALMMDSFVGPYYEEGLAKLKEISEEQADN